MTRGLEFYIIVLDYSKTRQFVFLDPFGANFCSLNSELINEIDAVMMNTTVSTKNCLVILQRKIMQRSIWSHFKA